MIADGYLLLTLKVNATAAHEVKQEQNNRQSEQQVDKTSAYARDQTQYPKEKQQAYQCKQHKPSLLELFVVHLRHCLARVGSHSAHGFLTDGMLW
jgi:hypothetical protein